jgi:hypothetical protein
LNSERIDPETLAAFLDGTLPASDRERILRALAQGGSAYEDLLEARALLDSGDAGTDEAPAPDSDPPVDPPAWSHGPAAPPWWRRANAWGVGSFLAAAGIVAVLLVQRRDQSPATSPTAATIQRVIAAVTDAPDLDSTFGRDWDQVNWSITRGPTQALDERVHAFRLGVRFVDFALASSANDPSARRRFAQVLAALAASAETGAPVAARVEALAADTTRRPLATEIASTSDDLRTLVSEPAWFDVGVWSESARLAVRAGQTTFFARDDAPMRELRHIVAELDANRSAATRASDELIEPLRNLGEQRAAANMSAIASVLDSTVARGGRE